MIIDFKHVQSAHCENGAISNLLRFHNLEISEPMAFGIGGGIFFAYMPFIKLNSLPVISYRIWPGQIFSRLTKALNIEVVKQKFSNKEYAMQELDRVLAEGNPVGLLTSVFYLLYLPKAYRFHFNAHNIVIFGKNGDNYLVSDPVMETTSEISYSDLMRARFAKGTFSPNGKMYYPVSVPQQIDLKKAIYEGIQKTCNYMLEIPVPLFGVNGIKYIASRMKKWEQKLGSEKAILYLGNMIRMQEEIGTGGAGFRFIYAAFLQEAGKKLNNNQLIELSKRMTEIGDRWREFAFLAGRICKNRSEKEVTFSYISDILLDCANKEKQLFKELKNIPFTEY